MAKTAKRTKRPASDPNLSGADMVARSLEAHDTPAPVKTFKDELSAYMSVLGRKGGKTSGKRRMTNLTARKRKEIAKKAATARWKR